MADRDRIEREIEEILAKLDVGTDGDTITGEREPISLLERRRTKKPPVAPRITKTRSALATNLSPATLLIAGAVVMVAGLLLSNWWEPLIWLSFAGIVVFLGAFLWSFRRRSGPTVTGGGRPKGVYWRDRYIEYEPEQPGPVSRVKRIFKRR